MHIGLTNTLVTFQAYINDCLRGLIDDFCIIYLDNILIFSKTEEEHIEYLKQVYRDIQKFVPSGLALNPCLLRGAKYH